VSQKSVEAVIGKVLLDEEFRKSLLGNPDNALAEFELTASEIAGIKSIDGETLDALAATLDARVARLRQMRALMKG
jgi:hypothetical protein